jgi:CxxC motif-containing protein (DUF1111 family)
MPAAWNSLGEELVMQRSNRIRWLIVAVVAVLPVGWRMLTWQRFRPVNVNPAMVSAGYELFHHQWKAGEGKDPLSPDGDGLGPVFNATSCVACHNQGGSGGGGSLANNVTTFSMRVGSQKPREGVVHAFAIDGFKETLRDVHPELPARSHPDLAELVPARNSSGAVGAARLIPMPAGVVISQVNPPALFGSGLIDAVPDRILIAAEKSERLKWGNAPTGKNELPVGRVARLPDGRIGKFGWKAQTASLGEFVQAACANELGLGNPNQPQPTPLSKPDYKPRGLDLTQEQCDQITAYVASLDTPTERTPVDLKDQADATAGKKLFGTIGCADCHTPNLGSVEGIYSDLLLHRMSVEMVGAGAYYEKVVPVPDSAPGDGPAASEWRTPPLWGVADSAPYMHDGRAATLEEAIKLHGGQAKRSATRFGELPEAQQRQLIAFLKTLRAPGAK